MNSISTSQTASLSNTPEQVVRQLRLAILRGEIKSREPLRQDKLAASLGVSKVPVREALAQLKAEGLVTYKSNRGAFVTALTAAEAKEIYLMRIALETIALQQAIPNLSKTDIARARSALMVIDVEEDISRWGELNWEFHAALYRHAGMPYLLNTIEMLHVNVTRYLTLYLDKMAFQTKSQVEHYALLDACAAGNIETATQILAGHLRDASTSLENFLGKPAGAGQEAEPGSKPVIITEAAPAPDLPVPTIKKRVLNREKANKKKWRKKK